MPKPTSADYDKALRLLKAAVGDFEPRDSLKRIISLSKDFGAFEWMLTIIGLEIDLRVDIPESLSDDHTRSASDFCKLVAKLPKVDSPGYTLECLGLVAQALLSLDLPVEGESLPKKRRARVGTRASTASGSAATRKRPVVRATSRAKKKAATTERRRRTT